MARLCDSSMCAVFQGGRFYFIEHTVGTYVGIIVLIDISYSQMGIAADSVTYCCMLCYCFCDAKPDQTNCLVLRLSPVELDWI